jgi:hypothetical protein
MEFPLNRIIDFAVLTTKPANNDAIAVYDVDANQQKQQLYGVFKTWFVRVDEDHDIAANHEYQTNFKLKFGSLGEFQLYNDSADMHFDNLKAGGKTVFGYKVGSIVQPQITINGTNSSIATHGNDINYDGSVDSGIGFNTDNEPIVRDLLRMNDGIRLNAYNISRTGAVGTGLEFDLSSNGLFNQSLIVSGDFQVNGFYTGIENHQGAINSAGQINANKTSGNAIKTLSNVDCGGNFQLNSNYISATGINGGLSFAGTGGAFSNGLGVTGGDFIVSNGYVEASGRIYSVTSYIRGYDLELRDGISTPGATTGYAKIYIDDSDGDLKIRKSDGTIKLIVTV